MNTTEPHVPLEACRIFFDGMLTTPQLDHPEGIALHPDGSVWCGGERGQIFRIEADGGAIEEVASTGGFCLGLTFADDGTLFVCDVKHAAVMFVDPERGVVKKFADGSPEARMKNPNASTFGPDGLLYVSDSHAVHQPGPGIFRFQADGAGTLLRRRRPSTIFRAGHLMPVNGSSLTGPLPPRLELCAVLRMHSGKN